jgi:hypothetical protein
MSIDERVAKLEAQMKSLQSAYIQSQRNEIPVRTQIDDLTPWTASKNAYIDDTECIFEGVPQGNVTVYCTVPHTVEKQDGRVVVKFEALTEVIEITISIL